MNSVIVIGGGLPASFLGGYLSDKLEDRIPNIKGLISGLGALAACPFIFITYIIQNMAANGTNGYRWPILKNEKFPIEFPDIIN